MGRPLQTMGRAIGALAVVLATLLAVLERPGGAVVLPQADIQVVGSVVEGPPGGGITTSDTMGYRLTIRNEGPTDIPGRSLLLIVYVEQSGDTQPWPMEVAGFESSNLRPAPGGACGVGRWSIVQCTNSRQLRSGDEITVRIDHRHPEAVAGALTFVAKVDLVVDDLDDPDQGDNAYRGPTYGFLDPPTTSTSEPTTTTASTSSTTSSTTGTSNSTSSTASSTTSSSTTTTEPTTSSSSATTAPTTTTPTTTPSVETSIAGLAGDATVPSVASLVSTSSTVTTESAPDQDLVAGPVAEGEQGGPPLFLLGALAALVLLIGGVGVAAFAYVNRAPPLVDIRTFD